MCLKPNLRYDDEYYGHYVHYQTIFRNNAELFHFERGYCFRYKRQQLLRQEFHEDYIFHLNFF